MAFKFLALSASIIVLSGIFLKNSRLNCNYLELDPSPEFSGNLAPNQKLAKAVYLAKGKVSGPETLEVSKDGLIYTGLSNGEVVSVDLEGNVKKIALIGDLKDESICKLGDFDPQCGRPMGLRLRQNFIYVADAYYGIVKIDITNGKKTTVISSKDKRFGSKPMKFTNDLDIDDNGVIYFIDTSHTRSLGEVLEEHIEAHPRGRLYSFNEKTNELQLLLNDLYFPNGIQLTPSHDALLINENTKARIIKYHLTGSKKGKHEVFAVLPGFSDSIRLTPQQTLLVPFGIPRVSLLYSLLDLLGRVPVLRNLLGVIDPMTIFKLSPKYGLLVEYDLKGNILRSWHDPRGEVVESTSSAVLIGNKVYIGSLFADYIAVINHD